MIKVKNLLNLFQTNSKFMTNMSFFQFSDSQFKFKDIESLRKYDLDKNHHPHYLNIRDGWQKPLEKKRRRRARKMEELANKEPIQEDTQKFVVHNPIQGIQYPPEENKIFAVVQILGRQFKIAQDDIVISDHLPQYDINDTIVFDKVMLVGTEHYTSIGRPWVETAKVFATVEQQTTSRTIEGFKYKRRKDYKRHWGARSKLTIFRINRIEHQLGEEQLLKATSLV